MAAQSDQFALLERVRSLEKEISDFEAWDAEKQRYEMKVVARGATVYAPEQDAQGSEPPHWICATCYQNRKKSILQGWKAAPRVRWALWRCNSCGGEIATPEFTSPEHPSHPSDL